MKQIEVACFNCSNIVVKDLKEYKRRTKLGQIRFFCNRSCSMRTKNKENPPKGNPDVLIPGIRRDEYTPFRWYVLRAQHRNKKKNYGCDITIEYLKKLWDEQKGICCFTGWNLHLPLSTQGKWPIENSSANASLDRIDNSKGYLQGNVRFISVMANMARNAFSDKALIDFCKAVSIFNK